MRLACILVVATLFGNPIEDYFPKTVEEIKTRKDEMIKRLHEGVDTFLQTPDVRLYDNAFGPMEGGKEMFGVLSMVHHDAEVRKAAKEAYVEIEFAQSSRPEVYDALATLEPSYFVSREMKKAKLNQPHVQGVRSEIAELEMLFKKNIAENRPTFSVSREELAGMEDAFIERLPYNNGYVLTTDYPIALPILSSCAVESTRKKMYEAFVSRGYPNNIDVLKKLCAKRNELAHLLGYSSFANMQLSSEMVQTPERAHAFLDEMEKALPRNEFEKPIEPWNEKYIITQLKKEKYDLDDEKIQYHFPLETTLKGLLSIYEKFFAITLKEVSSPTLWHEDVRLIQVGDLGSILLDLHPRENKYTHACCAPLLPPTHSMKALSVVICNFPKDFLRIENVRTFFHEFGHALHATLDRSGFISTAGCATAYDFVELPSQLLEEWLWNKEILRMVSPTLPEETMDAMIAAKNEAVNSLYMRQIMHAKYSLKVYQEPVDDPIALWHEMTARYRPHILPMENDYGCLSFGHLTEYGARYYGYLWSRVFAYDVFSVIEKEGLLNPEVGRRYAQNILHPGGSQDPNEMLYNFLGREPVQEAFIQSISR